MDVERPDFRLWVILICGELQQPKIKDPVKSTALQREISYYCIKRPGTARDIQPSAAAGTGRGTYFWPKTSKKYSVVGTKIYSGTTDLGVTLTTSTGRVGFAETRPYAATNYLGINDGVKLFIISTTDVVTTVTTNFPTPNTTDLIYMDQYWFVLKADGSLWNCAADDPTTWSLSTFLVSQMMAGKGVALARIANYVLSFSDRHIQYHYDQANPSGSPFTNVEQAMQKIGCSVQSSLAQDEDSIWWIGNGYNGEPTVWALDGTSSLNEIATEPITRLIGQEGSSLSSAIGMALRVAGHRFYILNLSGANRTFIWHPTIKMWTEWADTTTNSFPFMSVTQVTNAPLLQHTTDGYLYTISPTVYQDNAVNFTVTIIFGRDDFDTIKRKFCNRVDFIGDAQTTVANALSISYSDDDYATFSTARSYDPSIVHTFSRAWWNFRRRSWKVTYVGNTPFRGWGLELDLSLGN